MESETQRVTLALCRVCDLGRLGPVVMLMGALLTSALLTSCDSSASQPPPVVHATGLSPTVATPGSVVGVTGWGFGVQGDEDGLWLSGQQVEVSYWSERLISFQVPADVQGARSVVIRARGKVTQPLSLLVLSVEELEGGAQAGQGDAGGEAGTSIGGAEAGAQAGGVMSAGVMSAGVEEAPPPAP